MKAPIITAIKNTFGLKNEAIHLILATQEIYSVHGLLDLVLLLAESTSTPKQIGAKLDAVMVHIRLKSNPSTKESTFVNEINTLVYEPMYSCTELDDPYIPTNFRNF